MSFIWRRQVGAVPMRLASAWRQPVRALERLYAEYPAPDDGFAAATARLEPAGPLRRWLRPSVAIAGDFAIPDAAPLPLAQALLAAEMALNLQLALGWSQHLLLHAASVERDGEALLLVGESGSGKSTLAALLGERGWRLMGDEFVLLRLDGSGLADPHPRAVSLKNQSIAAMRAVVPDERRWGPMLEGTPKGTVRHLIPNARAIARQREAARPAMILFPRFGDSAALAPVGKADAFVRLTEGSTNYLALGRSAFATLTALVTAAPAVELHYANSEQGVAAVEQLWAAR